MAWKNQESIDFSVLLCYDTKKEERGNGNDRVYFWKDIKRFRNFRVEVP